LVQHGQRVSENLAVAFGVGNRHTWTETVHGEARIPLEDALPKKHLGAVPIKLRCRERDRRRRPRGGIEDDVLGEIREKRSGVLRSFGSLRGDRRRRPQHDDGHQE
jgi:hypothetical protein